jgi:hypothetical protein
MVANGVATTPAASGGKACGLVAGPRRTKAGIRGIMPWRA